MALEACSSSLVFITPGVMGANVACPLLGSAVHPPPCRFGCVRFDASFGNRRI